MITTQGHRHITAMFASHELTFGHSISLGVGSTAPVVSNESLEAEVIRVPIELRSPDYINDRVIFKAVVPASFAGRVSEVGINMSSQQRAPNTLFGDIDETWAQATPDTTHARIGEFAMRLDANASGSRTATVDKTFSIQPGSSILMNYFVGSNVSSGYVRLRTDASNYYHQALTTTAGYRSLEVPISSFTVTGNPSLDNITSVVVHLNSTAGGASQLHFDSLTILSPDFGGDLLARQVLPSPIIKEAGVEEDIEIPLVVTI